jgi:hypothetical protein
VFYGGECSKLTIIAGREAVKKTMVDNSSLDFGCPACGAMPRVRCFNVAGIFRFEPHIERKWISQGHRSERSPTMAIPQGSREIDEN